VTTQDSRTAHRVQLAGMLAITVAAVAATWIGLGPGEALFMGALLVAFTLFVTLGRRRSDSIRAMSGIGDERTQMLNLRAGAFAGYAMSFIIPGWWLITVARGEPNDTLSALGAIFAVVWIGATVFYARRH
jgi:hypothetical protein